MTMQEQYGGDYDHGYEQEQRTERPDGAKLLAELLERPLYQQKTTYVPFEGGQDNQVTLSPAIVLQFFAKPTKSGALCSYEQAVRFIMLCKARRLDPREGDAFLVGYDTRNGPEFNLITSHQAFLKRAEANAAYDGMESGITVQHDETEEVKDIAGEIIPDGCKLIGGWATVYRKDRAHPTYRRLALVAFDKGISVWGTNKPGMICKCAEADALRSTFPNSCGGLYIQGEVPPADDGVGKDAAPAKRISLRGMKELAEKAQNTCADALDQGSGSNAGGTSKPIADTKPTSATPKPAAETTGPAAKSPSPSQAGAAVPSNAPPGGGRPKSSTVQQARADGNTHQTSGVVGKPDADSVGESALPAASSAPPADQTHEPSMGVKEAEVRPQLCEECGSTMSGGACPSCGGTVASKKLDQKAAHEAAQAALTPMKDEQIKAFLTQEIANPAKAAYIKKAKVVMPCDDPLAFEAAQRKRFAFLVTKYELMDGVFGE